MAPGLPVVSGHNVLADQRRPRDTVEVVVLVGGQFADVRGLFGTCAVSARLDNEVRVDNEEQGEPIAVCRDPRGPWAQLWPEFAHLD
ncbi:MAG: hypothetical protein U0Q21_13310 [Dermatophilaceae bacterium]